MGNYIAVTPLVNTISVSSRAFGRVLVHRSASLIDILKPEKGVIWKFPKSLADINKDKEIASALALGKVSLHINLKWYDNIIILMLRIAFHKPVESS